MTTMELIAELRDQAEVTEPGTLYHLLQEAADRLEELDERLGIVMECKDVPGIMPVKPGDRFLIPERNNFV